jgi:uncharacterized protein YjcR
MAKFTETEKKQKIDYAKQLYCKGFDFDTIAELISVAATTIRKWAIRHDFEKAKKSQLIALSEIRATILESYADMLDGKKPKITPDAAAKYATAFEKFSAKKQVLTYIYEAYEMLTEAYQKEIQKAKRKADKENLLLKMQTTRKLMDTVITNLSKEVLGNE